MGPNSGLSFRQIRGAYFLAYESGMASWVPAVANMFPSDQPYEEYKWLESAPALEEWKGERSRKQLKEFLIRCVNKKYSSTLEFDVDDVQRDKTGQITRRIAELGTKASELPERLLTALLEANGVGYDGANFFAASHSHGGTVNNLFTHTCTAPDTPTQAEMAAAILKVLSGMAGFTDDAGEPLNQNAKNFAVIVPTKFAAATWAAVRDQFLAAGQNNNLRSADWNVQVYVNARLTGTAAAAGRRFYVHRTDAAIRSLIFQEHDVGNRALQVHGGENTDMGFWKDGMAVGPKRIAGATLGRFELAARCELQ